ncbi:hypothetical protein AB0I81_58515 [Nonomuraea sp. NPDC050404]|uniref:hypothetical protein n=1 Tax=Nonomuraea sp. NPDC050404 TaxID=3155783 RepID=UPI0033F73599
MTARNTWRQKGTRVQISSIEHSPMTTRALAPLITGHTGVVIAVMRDGRLAFVSLDGEHCDLPNGIRRWMLHWDDLTELHPHPGGPGLRNEALDRRSPPAGNEDQPGSGDREADPE